MKNGYTAAITCGCQWRHVCVVVWFYSIPSNFKRSFVFDPLLALWFCACASAMELPEAHCESRNLGPRKRWAAEPSCTVMQRLANASLMSSDSMPSTNRTLEGSAHGRMIAIAAFFKSPHLNKVQVEKFALTWGCISCIPVLFRCVRGARGGPAEETMGQGSSWEASETAAEGPAEQSLQHLFNKQRRSVDIWVHVLLMWVCQCRGWYEWNSVMSRFSFLRWRPPGGTTLPAAGWRHWRPWAGRCRGWGPASASLRWRGHVSSPDLLLYLAWYYHGGVYFISSHWSYSGTKREINVGFLDVPNGVLKGSSTGLAWCSTWCTNLVKMLSANVFWQNVYDMIIFYFTQFFFLIFKIEKKICCKNK